MFKLWTIEFIKLFKITVYSYIIIITLRCTVNSQTLISGPVDVRAAVGTDAIFKCSANIESPYALIWRDLNDIDYIISFGEDTGSSQYSIIVSDGGSYDLKITDVQITNAGDYECTYGYYDNERSLYIYSSFSTPATATLTVLQPPSATSPRCSLLSRDEAVISAETPFYAGESIRLQCISEGHGSTYPKLGITVSNTSVDASIKRVEFNYTEVESENIMVDNYDTELKCHLSSEALEETRTCTITLNVLLPEVEIYPSMQSVQESTDVYFQCSASNFKTNNLQYEWQIAPYVPGDIFNSKDSILNITDISLNNNLLDKQIFNITCLVTEDGRIWNAATTLSITRIYLPSSNHNSNKIDGQTNTNINSESENAIVGVVIGSVVVAIFVVLLIVVFVFNRQKLNRIIFRNKTTNASVNDTPLYSDVQNMNTITPNADEGGDSYDNAAVYYSSVPNDADNYDNVCNINDNDEALYENRPFTRDVTELNVEGLNYAVLDLQESPCDIISTNHTTTYATLEN